MKKLFVSLSIALLSISFGFAQSAATATNATQTVNAADKQKAEAVTGETKSEQCTTAKKDCCMHGRSDMQSASATTATGAELSKSAESCKSVSFGMSAEKPKKETAATAPNK